MNYFTADTHFYHKNVIEYCNRPFRSIEQMNKTIIDNINERVTKEDSLWILGDFTMMGKNNRDALESIVSKINGHKHLVLGNHDRLKPFDYCEIGFDSVHTWMQLWEEGQNWHLIHDPAMAEALPKTVNVLCGHVHTLFKNCGMRHNVGVDVRDFKPVTIKEIMNDYKCEQDNRQLSIAFC